MISEIKCPDCASLSTTDAKFCLNCGCQLSSNDTQSEETLVLDKNNDFSATVILGASMETVIRTAPGLGHEHDQDDGPLLKIEQEGKEPIFVNLTSDDIAIGRDTSNDIVIELLEVSRTHARITYDDSGYSIVDLNSTNGTYLRGRIIQPMQANRLGTMDKIRIGDQFGNSVSLTFLQGENSKVSSPDHSVDKTEISEASKYTIGRDPRCDLPLASPVVSWHHAEVVQTEEGRHLYDLGSTNGTFVNGTLTNHVLLKPDDVILVGPYQLVYSEGGFEQFSSVGNVRLDGVCLRKEVSTSSGSKILLNDISLTVMPREFIALVGGSGAGKSTLMDALNGFRKAESGTVLLNGDDLYQHFSAYRTNIGYVPQADIIHTGLTVQRCLRYTALLRLPPDTTTPSIDQRIDEVLQQVEILPQKDQQIASLSGGQRKRVSIASELLSDPNLFFLDEPTSGLDPGLDKKMMNTMNLLSDNGSTVILTTHATRNIGKCDHVAFMAHGRMVYYGSPVRATEFFQVEDFTNIYEKLESPHEAQNWEQRYKKTDEYCQLIKKRQAAAKQSVGTREAEATAGSNKQDFAAGLRQFKILSRRYLDLIFNDKMSMITLLAVMPVIALLVLLIANSSSLTGDSAVRIDQILAERGFYTIVTESQKLLLIMTLSVILFGVFAAAYEIIKEKPVYRRERMVNLGILPYISSKVMVLFGFGLVQCLALMIIVGLKVPLPDNGAFLPAPLEIYITLSLSLLAGLSIGLLISAAVGSRNMVIYLVLVILIVQIIFSGALFEIPATANPISYMTPTRWALEGLGASVNMDGLNSLSQQFIEEIDGSPVNNSMPAPVNFDINYSNSTEHLLLVWLILFLFAAAFIGLTALMLKRQDVHS